MNPEVVREYRRIRANAMNLPRTTQESEKTVRMAPMHTVRKHGMDNAAYLLLKEEVKAEAQDYDTEHWGTRAETAWRMAKYNVQNAALKKQIRAALSYSGETLEGEREPVIYRATLPMKNGNQLNVLAYPDEEAACRDRSDECEGEYSASPETMSFRYGHRWMNRAFAVKSEVAQRYGNRHSRHDGKYEGADAYFCPGDESSVWAQMAAYNDQVFIDRSGVPFSVAYAKLRSQYERRNETRIVMTRYGMDKHTAYTLAQRNVRNMARYFDYDNKEYVYIELREMQGERDVATWDSCGGFEVSYRDSAYQHITDATLDMLSTELLGMLA